MNKATFAEPNPAPRTAAAPPPASRGAAAQPLRRARGAAFERASRAERITQALVLAVLVGALGLGVWLRPAPEGVGTHCQLGLPPCGMLQATGLPCPTCGVTTAFALAAHGRLGAALVTQPLGLALFGLALGGAVALAGALATGRSLLMALTPERVAWTGLALVLLLLASWTYKLATV